MDFIAIENINKELLDYLINTIEEHRCIIDRLEWRSKYNNYVVYDYEPFCSDGFEITMIIKGEMETLQFILFLYNRKINQIEHLNKCLNMKNQPICREKQKKIITAWRSK